MGGLKSAYREKKSANKPEQDNKYAAGGSVLNQVGQHDPGLHPKTPVVAATPEAAQGNPSVVVGVRVGHDSANGDEATQRLQQQLAYLQQSERIQRDPTAAKPSSPISFHSARCCRR